MRAGRARNDDRLFRSPLLPHLHPHRSSSTIARIGLTLAAEFLLSLAPALRLGAQDTTVRAMAARLASMSAVTGYEHSMVDTLLHLLPGAARDRTGNAQLMLGVEGAKRLVVCPLDEPGYVVGGLREDGYVTLRRVPGRVSPLFDQQMEGHRVTIQGARRPVPGVVAVRSIHLTRGRPALGENLFTVDDAYVDVGARSRSEAVRIGIAVLAPVTLAKRPHTYGEGLLAAPVAGRRAACAALLTASQDLVARAQPKGRVVIAFAIEQELAQRGLATLANGLGPFDETLIVDGVRGAPGALEQQPDTITSSQWPGLGRVTRWSLPVRYAGTPVETVSLADADSLRKALVGWIAGGQ